MSNIWIYNIKWQMKETLINYSNRKSVNKEIKRILLKQKNYVPQQVIAPGIG